MLANLQSEFWTTPSKKKNPAMWQMLEVWTYKKSLPIHTMLLKTIQERRNQQMSNVSSVRATTLQTTRVVPFTKNYPTLRQHQLMQTLANRQHISYAQITAIHQPQEVSPQSTHKQSIQCSSHTRPMIFSNLNPWSRISWSKWTFC